MNHKPVETASERSEGTVGSRLFTERSEEDFQLRQYFLLWILACL